MIAAGTVDVALQQFSPAEPTAEVPTVQPPLVLTSPSDADQAPVLVCTVSMDTMPSMDTTTSVVHLVGELDIESTALLFSVVEGEIRQDHTDLRVDLSGLTFCDLPGMYALRVAQQRLHAAGGQLVLLNPSAFLQRVAGLCGMHALFDPAEQ